MRTHLASCFVALIIVACGDTSSGPPPPTAPPAAESAEVPAPPPPDAPPPPAAPPPGPAEWVPPVLPTRSAGCGTARANPVGEGFTTPGGRTFHVWGPAKYDPNKAYPVVYTFHGLESEGLDFQSWFEMEKYVSGAAFVVYPDAVNGKWDLSGTSDLVFFDDMSKMMSATYCTNPSRALGFGFSYGGIFMNVLGCKRAGYVRAIAIGDGSGSPAGAGCGRLPVLITARTADTNETVAGARHAEAGWTKVNGCSATTTTSDASMNCVAHASCKAPGSLVFCEDTFYDPSWPADWNHTVREPYRTFTYQWFAALP